jgi:hypothetical protein
MTLWTEIEMTDHPNNTHNSTFSVAVGARLGNVIEIELQTLQVTRSLADWPDIVVNMTLVNATNTTVFSAG